MMFDLDFFAALRRMKAASQAGISGAAISGAVPARQPTPDATPRTSVDAADPVREPGAAGIALIRRFEGCAQRRADGQFEAYPDPGTGGAPWTIGWGATGPGIAPGVVWTREQCDARLESDLHRYARDVTRALADSPTTQAQFDALVSFHYNTGAIFKATLTRLHCKRDYAGAAAEFGKWIKAGGRTMPGLVRRRAAEAALYRSD